MLRLILLFLGPFLFVVGMTPFLIQFSKRSLLMLDAPGTRKIHADPIPRLGGVAIFIAVWLVWAMMTTLKPELLPTESRPQFVSLFYASLLIWCVGVYDDVRGASALVKLIPEIIAAIFVWKAGIGVYKVTGLSGRETPVSNELLSLLITVAWIVIVTNAINLIDGLDGLAGGVCLISALAVFFISRELGKPELAYFCLCIAGACGGFLVFNFRPASIFLGDSGALFLGFILACLSVMSTAKRSTAIVLFGPPLILALPMIDTIAAILRRLSRRIRSGDKKVSLLYQPKFILQRFREIFQADQNHIHHGLLKIGLSHAKAVIILYFVTLLFGVTAYRLTVGTHVLSTLIVFGALSLGLLFLLRQARRNSKRSGA